MHFPRRVLVFPDTFVQFFNPDLGMTVSQLLHHLDCGVAVYQFNWADHCRPRVREHMRGLRCCGRPMISNGLLVCRNSSVRTMVACASVRFPATSHSKHKSSASNKAASVKPPSPSWPVIARRKASPGRACLVTLVCPADETPEYGLDNVVHADTPNQLRGTLRFRQRPRPLGIAEVKFQPRISIAGAEAPQR